MFCPNCEKEIPVSLFDETPGAVFIIKDSGDKIIGVWPAVWGIKKYEGCIEFGRGVEDGSLGNDDETVFLTLCDEECDEVYFDHPKPGEAWLVKPTKDGYEWTQVDDQIVFSEGE